MSDIEDESTYESLPKDEEESTEESESEESYGSESTYESNIDDEEDNDENKFEELSEDDGDEPADFNYKVEEVD